MAVLLIAGDITALLRESAHSLGKCVVTATHDRAAAEQADVVLSLRGGGQLSGGEAL